jgi:hypothetical protein
MSMLDPVYPVGNKADAAATSDTGSFSIVAFIKRSLQNWTTLLAAVSAGFSVPAVSGTAVATIPASDVNGMSNAIDMAGARAVRIAMPAAWTAANLTFQASYDNATWNNLYSSDGSEYTVIAAASRSIILPYADFMGIRYLKVRSGTSSAAVQQGADRALVIQTLG